MKLPLQAVLACVALAALAACGPRKPAPGPAIPAPVDESVVQSNSDGVVVGAAYRDATAGLDLAIPPGWRATPRFRAGRSGPPPVGVLRVRLDEAATGCLIDVALEPVTVAEPTGETLRRERELFFFSPIEEPSPQFAFEGLWTGTFIPADATKLDVGYWIRRAQGGEPVLVRIEGRFPLVSVTACKAALDAVVRSLKLHDAASPRAISRE